MSSEWPRASLREFVDLLAGFAFKSSGYTDVSEDVRLLRGDNIAPGKVRWDGVKRWPIDGGADLSKYVLEPGDVVLAMDRPWIPAGLKVAQVTKTDTPSYLVQRVARLRAASRSDCDFLFALLSTPDFDSYIQNATTGTAVPHISAKQILDYEFRLPPASARAEIGTLVAEVNDRIALLRETNATLEAIAQALFKSWFVDFDPVRAKMAGRAPEGMDEATAALFPDGLEETTLGLVPKGWSVKTLADITAYLSRSISPKYVDDGGLLVLNQKCVRDFSIDWSKARRHDPSQRKVDGRLLEKGDVLVNSTGVGTLGRVGQILSLPEPAIVDSHVTVVRAGEAVTWPYLGQSIQSRQEQIEAMGEGSTGQTELSRSKLGSMPFLVPARAALAAFDTAVLPLKARISCNADTAQSLSGLRDVLLPRLISGQLRLPEAQAQLEEALA